MRKERLDFDDIIKMGYKKGYKLLHDIVKHDMDYQAKKTALFIKKLHLIKELKNEN